MEVGLLLIRVVLGAIMAAHGAQKLFGWFGGHGLAGTRGWLDTMGFKPAGLHATVVGLAEFGGGALLALGLLTPLGAAGVAGVMYVAVATVHWKNGFFNTGGGYEFNLLIAATAIALAITGPGKISIDHLAGWTLAGPTWALAALGISAAAAGSVLALASRSSRRNKKRSLARRSPQPEDISRCAVALSSYIGQTGARWPQKGAGR